MPKFKGLPIDVYTQVGEWLDKQKETQEIIVLVSNKETKEMLQHTQRKMFRGLFGEISKHLGIDPEETKQNFLKGVFGVKETKTGLLTFENALKPTTSELTKQEASLFIDSIMKFIEKYGVPCKYTAREIESLYNTYNQ